MHRGSPFHLCCDPFGSGIELVCIEVAPFICVVIHLGVILSVCVCVCVCVKVFQNGSSVECAFWDQALDEGYGAFSTEGCRIRQNSKGDVSCRCNHLTSFAVVAVSQNCSSISRKHVYFPPVPQDASMLAQAPGIGKYINLGSVFCLLFVTAVLLSYLISG